MNGYQLIFFTQQDRSHGGRPLADWIVHTAQHMGIRGATVIPASEGYGAHRRLHAARFFELADQPLEVMLAVTAEEADQLFERLRAEQVHVFYMKTPIEFGVLGEA